MNERESRFMRLKRYAEDDIEALHHKEREAGKNWLEVGVRYMDQLDSRLGPYFDSGKLHDEQAREVAAFQSCPVVRRVFAQLDATDLDEIPAVHQADWKVWKQGYMPHLGKGNGDSQRQLAAIYTKAKTPLPYQD